MNYKWKKFPIETHKTYFKMILNKVSKHQNVINDNILSFTDCSRLRQKIYK